MTKNENNYTVYMHKNKINSKVYIGITKQKPKYRWNDGNGYKTQIFYKAIQKYGWNNFEHYILFQHLTKEEAEKKEIELIAEYKSNQKKYGYNIENGGHIQCVSEQTKEKLRQTHKGENAYWYGKRLSEETKEKLSKAHKGKKLSKITKQKMSESRKGKSTWNKGKHHTEETKQKMKENNAKYWKGKHLSITTKEKLHNANVGRKHTEEELRKMSKKVICLETGIIYNSIREAERKTGVNKSKICICCKNNCGWRYYEE